MVGPGAADRLGRGAHDLDDLVVSRRACRRPPPRRRRAPTPRGQAVRSIRVRQGERSPARRWRPAAMVRAAFALQRAAGRGAGARRLPHPDPVARGRRRHVHQGARQPLPVSAGAPGIRFDGAVWRIPPRYSAIPRRRQRLLSRTPARVFQSRGCRGGERDITLLPSFPAAEAGRQLAAPWRSMATQLYANWLSYLAERRAAPAPPHRTARIREKRPAPLPV